MTKICVVGPSKKYFSGISAHTIYLSNAFSMTNNVSVLTLRNLLPRFLYPGHKNVDRQDYSIEFKGDVKIFEGMDWNSPLSWIKAYRFLKREKPDVIIMPWWTSAVAHMELFLVIANSVSIKAKLILDMHEILDPLENSKAPLRLYSKIMGGWIMKRASAFVVHSDAVKDQALKAYHLSENKVFVIPMGVYDNNSQGYSRESSRKELGIKEDFVVLYFGMIRKYKGVPYLVEAFNKLPGEVSRNTRLIIAGEDWGDEESLGKIIEASPYNKQITFQPEFVPDYAMPKYFSAADVVVLPYLRTTGSGVASLVMAFGKPLIISELESIRETLNEYEGTMFVPCGDASCITEKILEVYARYKEGKIITYAPPRRYGWDQVTGQFQKVIDQIK